MHGTRRCKVVANGAFEEATLREYQKQVFSHSGFPTILHDLLHGSHF